MTLSRKALSRKTTNRPEAFAAPDRYGGGGQDRPLDYRFMPRRTKHSTAHRMTLRCGGCRTAGNRGIERGGNLAEHGGQ